MEDNKGLMDMFTGSPISMGANSEMGTRTPTTPPRYLSRQFSGTGYSDGGSPNTPGSFDQSMRWGQSGTAGWDFPADPDRSATSGTETGGLTLQQLINYYGQNAEMSQPLFHLPTDYITWQNLQQISTLLMLSQSNINVGPFLGKAPSDNVYPLDSYLATPSLYIADTDALNRAAKYHRKAATTHDANCTWSGSLPQGSSTISGYSPKVFLGGVPWDITEQMLITTFKHIGPVKVEWPGKDQHAAQPKGYVYVIFETDKQVRTLISLCNNNKSNGSKEDAIYYKISSKRMKSKEVQVIPWALDDSNVMRGMSQKLDPNKTVFVGALHGMLNAVGLAKIMNDLFDGVVYAGIDTDKYKYPIGSGRVTFDNKRSYTKAVQAAFIEVKTSKFSKKIQVDPYLEDTICSMCGVQQGPYFCRELLCFRYYCRTCWHLQHPVTDAVRSQHSPLMKALRPPPSAVV